MPAETSITLASRQLGQFWHGYSLIGNQGMSVLSKRTHESYSQSNSGIR